jgi:hypothetical protein
VSTRLFCERAERSGVTADVDVRAPELRGTYGVMVDRQSGDAMYDVDDRSTVLACSTPGDDLPSTRLSAACRGGAPGSRPQEVVRQVAPAAVRAGSAGLTVRLVGGDMATA